MKTQGNTILITGGGSGIGAALASAFHSAGNQVVIAGRRTAALGDVARAHPGMATMPLDIEDPAAVRAFAAKLLAAVPALDVVVHNAGIMRPEDLRAGAAHLADAEAMVATNLLGPMRLTAALVPHLLRRPRAAIVTVTSGLAFVPLAGYPAYCATKAGLHSWTESLRWQLRGTWVEVIEAPPPYVQTGLIGDHQETDPRAMPLPEYIAETMRLLAQEPTPPEILVERVKPLRAAPKADYDGFFRSFNEAMSS
jgi:uncharacterized oxidoreductase